MECAIKHNLGDSERAELGRKLEGLNLKSQGRRWSFESNDSSSGCSLRIKAGADSDYSDSSCSSSHLLFGPHDGFRYGPPNPHCHDGPDGRLATAKAIHQTMELRDGELESTLRLLCRVFEVDTATVALLTGERIYLVAACGALPVCVCPDRWGFCGWSFLNPNHELNVVEDMEKDTRFCENFFVVSENFRLVFYVMAPLVSSNGNRIGTLCIMGQEPRKFDATRGAILANLSELLVRQIEARWAKEAERKCEAGHLKRAAEAYSSATGFIDASDPGNWRILHLNGPAVQLLGCGWSATYEELAKLDEGRHKTDFQGVPITSFLDIDTSLAVWDGEDGAELRLNNIKGAKGTPAEGKLFNLTCKLAASEALDQYAPFSIGVPSWLQEASPRDPVSRNYYFMHIQQVVQQQQRPQQLLGLRLYGPRCPGGLPVPNLVLGPLLGRGGFGKVFRGVHEGQLVAVKIIESVKRVRVDKFGIPLEAALTKDMHHLGVLRTRVWALGPPDVAAAAAARRGRGVRGDREAEPTCWMVTDYCDKGTLGDAVVKGWFRVSPSPTSGGTNLRTVALTAYEVASAMAYIHSHDVLHLDLSAANVLLRTFPSNPHGFSASVGDFGLARTVEELKQRANSSKASCYGTVTYMAPETIMQGVLGASCDVYAFGVQLWEMLTGSRAWAGLRHEQVLYYVGAGSMKLAPVEGLEGPLKELLEGTLQHNPEKRWTFQRALDLLEHYLQSTRNLSVAEVTLPLNSTAPKE